MAAELNRVVEHVRSVLVKQGTDAMTDGDLVKRYREQRDDVAFEALVRRHGPMVMGVCRRVLRNLRVYAGPEHPHAAQNPQPLDIAAMNRKNARA